VRPTARVDCSQTYYELGSKASQDSNLLLPLEFFLLLQEEIFLLWACSNSVMLSNLSGQDKRGTLYRYAEWEENFSPPLPAPLHFHCLRLLEQYLDNTNMAIKRSIVLGSE
jgi:hypothetical protein